MAPYPTYINYRCKVSIVLHFQLCSTHYTAVRIKKRTFAIKVAPMKLTIMNWKRLPQLYHLKVCFQQINNCSKRTSVIKVATMKNTDDFHYKRKPSHADHKIDTSLSAKMDGKQRRMLVNS